MSDSEGRIRELEERAATQEQLLEQATKLIHQQQEEMARLRIDNERLQKEVEQWRRGHRVRRHRFSSCPEAKRSRLKKRPGRKVGHPGARRPVPQTVDVVVEHALERVCDCGGAVSADGEMLVTYVEDIELRRRVTEHRGQAGVCTVCHKKKSPKAMPGVESGSVVTRTQLGSRVKSYVLSQRHRHGVSYARMSESLVQDFGLRVTPSGLCHSVIRDAERMQPVHQSIRRELGEARTVGMDETGYRWDGANAWCWLGRSDRASFFSLQRSRGQRAFEAVLPLGFTGVLVTDFYSVYTGRKSVLHAYCGAHLIREAKAVAEVNPSRDTREFARRIGSAYRMGASAKSFDQREAARAHFARLASIPRYQSDPELARLTARMRHHFEGVVAFVGRNDIPWNNNATERDLRPICLLRKTTGSVRSERGAMALSVWMSITRTLRKNGMSLANWLHNALQADRNGSDLPSVFVPR